MMLLLLRLRVWRTPRRLKDADSTSEIRLKERSKALMAGARKSRKFFGTLVRELWLASRV